MTALLETIQHERVGHWSKAIPAIARSFPATIHARQKGHAGIAFRGLSRGHVVCGVVQMDHVVKACRLSYRLGLALLFPVDWRRFGRRPFHSHRPEFSSLAGRLVVERAFPAALAITNSRDHHGSRRSVVHSATRQHFSQAVADVVHLSRLSYSPSFDGSKKPWKWRQELGKVIQGRGHFVQGGGRCD